MGRNTQNAKEVEEVNRSEHDPQLNGTKHPKHKGS